MLENWSRYDGTTDANRELIIHRTLMSSYHNNQVIRGKKNV